MLLQNPQLAYALLQAQIVMKIVDPQVAMVRDLSVYCVLYWFILGSFIIEGRL